MILSRPLIVVASQPAPENGMTLGRHRGRYCQPDRIPFGSFGGFLLLLDGPILPALENTQEIFAQVGGTITFLTAGAESIAAQMAVSSSGGVTAIDMNCRSTVSIRGMFANTFPLNSCNYSCIHES